MESRHFISIRLFSSAFDSDLHKLRPRYDVPIMCVPEWKENIYIRSKLPTLPLNRLFGTLDHARPLMS